jgi:uncharacterized protein YjaG (DUF416 family)
MTVNIGKTEFNRNFPFIEWLAKLPDLLISLGMQKTILFLVACCERQFGNYAQFNQETGWGDPQVLCEGLQSLRNCASAVEVASIKSIRQAIERVTPSTEDFKSVYTSAALDAATSLLESLDYCVDGNVSHCVQVACLCRDSIYMFVQRREGYDYSDADEVKIYADPLMVRELQAQQIDLERIKSSSNLSSLVPLGRHGCDPDGGSLLL